MKPLLASLALSAAFLAGPAPAAESLGRPTYGGPGCPDGTASAVLKGTTLSVRYSAYRVEAGGGTGKRFDRRACSLSVPVSVPRGKSVAIVSADYRGRGRLPAGAKGEFRAEYFFAGETGPVAKRALNGPLQGAFSLSTPGGPLVWSPCGKDVILRTNSSLRVTTAANRSASLSIRSQDVSNALVYRLKWRDC